MQHKKQNFVQGAFILLISSLVVKFIGALFQIPLVRMVGVTNMGLFNTAYSVYMVMLVVSSVGLPAALSKMVAEAIALGKEHEVRRIVKVASCIYIPIGAICSIALFLGAEVLTGMIGNTDAKLAVMAISPAVLMVSILAVFRGYYQGRSNMIPTGVSQIIEALGKLILGLAFATYSMSITDDSAIIAAAIIFGITIGEVLAVLYLIISGIARKTKKQYVARSLNDSVRKPMDIAKSLLTLSIPITINSAVMSITDLIDLSLIMNRLADIGMSTDQANAYFGAYKTMAVNFFNLPQTLITAIAVSALPAIASAKASQNFTKISRTMGTTFRMTMIITLPSCAGFLLLSGPILRLVYSSDTEIAAPLMQILGLAVPCVALVAITNSILQAIGRADLPLISMFMGGVVKLFGDYILLGNPNINIKGAPISTVMCYALIAFVNLIHIHRLTNALPSFRKTFVKPFIATLGMSAAISISFIQIMKLLDGKIGSFEEKIATIVTVIVAFISYAILLIALKVLEKEDVEMLPMGKKIAKILRM